MIFVINTVRLFWGSNLIIKIIKPKRKSLFTISLCFINNSFSLLFKLGFVLNVRLYSLPLWAHIFLKKDKQYMWFFKIIFLLFDFILKIVAIFFCKSLLEIEYIFYKSDKVNDSIYAQIGISSLMLSKCWRYSSFLVLTLTSLLTLSMTSW